MSCLQRLGVESAGSDIDFSIRPDQDGAYPDISDMTASVKGVYNNSVLFDISIGNPSVNGSTVTLEVDDTSQYIAIHIESTDTVGLSGDLEIYTELDSIEYGNRTEAKGSYRICEVK